MIITTLLVLGIPLIIFMTICCVLSSVILAIIQGICEGIFGILDKAIDEIGKK